MENKQITKAQIIKIHTLLPNQIKQDKDEKKEWVKLFTKDERSSVKQLSFKEANNALEWLGATPQVKRVPSNYYAQFDKKNSQHLYLLSLCHQIGWVQYHEGLAKNVPDLKALGSWIHKHGYLHKSLKLYTPQELPKLIKQFENMVKNYTK